MTAEKLFRAFVKYCYEPANRVKTKIVRRRKAPVWCDDKKNNRYAVYFKRTDMPRDKALLTGHGKTYEAAFSMLLEFYMQSTGVSKQELELFASCAGDV